MCWPKHIFGFAGLMGQAAYGEVDWVMSGVMVTRSVGIIVTRSVGVIVTICCLSGTGPMLGTAQ